MKDITDLESQRPSSFRRCLTLITICLLSLFSLLIVRYYKIQIYEGERWAGEALGQHEIVVQDPFRRGTFFSNTCVRKWDVEQQQPLAIDITKFHLCLDALSVPEKHRDAVAQHICDLVGGDYEYIRKELDRRSRYRKVYVWLDHAVRDRVLAWWKPFASKHKIPSNALFFIRDYQRSYPFGKLLGQVLHTVRDAKDEKTGKAYPTGGVEAYFNHILEGDVGKRKLLRSPLNRLDIDQVIQIPKDGADVYLTINACIQTIAEQELEIGVRESRAQGGRVVIMHARTGEILALAQYPFFDPSEYKSFFNDKTKIEHTKVTAVNDVFEPGSIMKPITVTIALLANKELIRRGEAPLFDPHEPIDVTRKFFPGRKKSPLRDVVPNRQMNMYMAIQKSSNVYMAQLADRIIQRLGHDWYEEQLKIFGFGKRSGIELLGEAPGLVPSPKRYYPNGASEWSLATPTSLSMGYNLLVTSMQMVRAYGMIANGGYEVFPTLVKKIKDSSGKEIRLQPAREPQQVFPEEVLAEVLTAMRFTTCPGGSGFRASPRWHSSAGKTGTTEKLINGRYDKRRHISSFIGITPIESSQESLPLVMIVSIDDPAHFIREDGTKNYMGGRCAAPVFGRIADRVLAYLGAERDKEKNDYKKEVAALKALYDEWNRKT